MPDTPAPPAKTSSFGFLGRKIGPAPIWLIGVAVVGAYYWYKHYGPGAAPAVPVPAAGAPQENITIRETEGRGPRGPRGPRGFRGRPPVRRPVKRGFKPRGSRSPSPVRGPAPPMPRPETAAAPMTSGDVYGDQLTAMPDGSTYDSGDIASTMGAAYAVAGA